jgi:hypothetical protein
LAILNRIYGVLVSLLTPRAVDMGLNQQLYNWYLLILR